jgi:hypothetical protein
VRYLHRPSRWCGEAAVPRSPGSPRTCPTSFFADLLFAAEAPEGRARCSLRWFEPKHPRNASRSWRLSAFRIGRQPTRATRAALGQHFPHWGGVLSSCAADQRPVIRLSEAPQSHRRSPVYRTSDDAAGSRLAVAAAPSGLGARLAAEQSRGALTHQFT